jgi:hypothetical protein
MEAKIQTKNTNGLDIKTHEASPNNANIKEIPVIYKYNGRIKILSRMEIIPRKISIQNCIIITNGSGK